MGSGSLREVVTHGGSTVVLVTERKFSVVRFVSHILQSELNFDVLSERRVKQTTYRGVRDRRMH